MATIPASHADLLTTKVAFANLATLNARRQPAGDPRLGGLRRHATCWSTPRKGRVKAKNLAREPRVALSIADPENPYRYLGIQGRVDRDDRNGRRCAHRQDGEEVPRQGHLSVSHAGRSPHHREDRAGQSPHERLALQVRGPSRCSLFPAFPTSTRGADLGALIAAAAASDSGARVDAGDVFVVAQKIVSKAEGAIVRLDEVVPRRRRRSGRLRHGKDARVVEVIFREVAADRPDGPWHSDRRDASRIRVRERRRRRLERRARIRHRAARAIPMPRPSACATALSHAFGCRGRGDRLRYVRARRGVKASSTSRLAWPGCGR